jgi:hypothetical protein
MRLLFLGLLLGFTVAGGYQSFVTLQPGRWGSDRPGLYITLTLTSIAVGGGLVTTSFMVMRRSQAATARLHSRQGCRAWAGAMLPTWQVAQRPSGRRRVLTQHRGDYRGHAGTLIHERT